jgi:hypothetical protein
VAVGEEGLMAAYSTCPTAANSMGCPYTGSCGNAYGITCPIRYGSTSGVIIIHPTSTASTHAEVYSSWRRRLRERVPTLHEMKARLSREAVRYWGRLERNLPQSPLPPPPSPRTRNRCCSVSSKHMVSP